MAVKETRRIVVTANTDQQPGNVYKINLRNNHKIKDITFCHDNGMAIGVGCQFGKHASRAYQQLLVEYRI